MEPPQRWSVSAPWVFRDTEYTVSADVRNDVLVVEVEEKLTSDQWRGQFEAKHIEELTRKTGNFKQFPIFLNMLESAISKSSDCVTLDLLTYSDLEALRNKKLGVQGPSPAKNGRQLRAKRYLILTYSVEFDSFPSLAVRLTILQATESWVGPGNEAIHLSHLHDRIHYPLALPYTGKPDPVLLQATIRALRTELERSRKQGQKPSALYRLQKEYDALLQEKEEVEEAFESFKQEVMLTREGNASKEIRVLKKVIKNLEEDILKERTKHQRYANKKNEEMRALLQEVEELRSSERTLRTRVKSLTNELAVLKRNLRSSPLSFRTSTSTTRKPSHLRKRSSSADRHHHTASGGRNHSRIRTPSPSGARVPRFDPTSFIENKKRKQQEVDIRLGRVKLPSGRSRGMRSRTNSGERPPKPTSSVERSAGHSRKLYSGSRGRPRRTSSVCSVSSCGSSRGSSRRSSTDLSGSNMIVIGSGHQGSGSKRVSSQKRRQRRQAWESPTISASTPVERRPAKSNAHNDSGHTAEISEIDARLMALQQFMKRSLETTKNYSSR